MNLAQICPAFNWFCHLGMDAADAYSVLHSASICHSALLLHVLLLSDNLHTCTYRNGILFYCVITMFEALYHCTALGCMCFIDADTSI